MHVKIITPESLVYDQPIITMVKRSSRGILGSDRADLVKRASSEVLAHLDSLMEKVGQDETLIHLLAVGATEDYGANRNGDGFSRATCEQCHPSFVKFAHFFRNHKNKDPKKSYGRIIKSAFHNPMKRIELLASLYSTDAAARRHGGLVADREMEKLASGKDIPVSMACKVGYDVCSYCGNKAPQVADYCTGTHQGGMCKAGGLRDNIGALVEIDGGIHQLHADNPHPAFFDISHVFRPADRIAYVTGALEKAAAARGGIVKSSELAQQLGITVPCELLIDGTQPPNVQRMVKLAYKLADIEADIARGDPPLAAVNALAFAPSVQGSDVPFALPSLFREKFALALRALTDQRICLPLARFIEVTTDHGHEKAAELAEVVARELPGVYTRLLEGSGLPDQLQASQYGPAQAAAPPIFTNWAVKQASDLSLAKGSVYNRVTRASLRQEELTLREPCSHEKIASDRDPAERLASEYSLYKLAFLGSVPDSDPDFEMTASLAILQNYAN
jgi:hypothetical protein